MLLQLNNIKKAIGVEEILTNISFAIAEKEKVALVGVNGAGKTSVFRLLTGQWQADEGVISKSNSTRIGYLPQETMASAVGSSDVENCADSPEPSAESTLYDALDSVFLPLKQLESQFRELEAKMGDVQGAKLEEALKRYDSLRFRFEESGGYEMESRVKGVLRGLGFADAEWQQPFGQLSGGQRTRAMLGRLLLSQSDLLLLDEPTNHLDITSVAWLEEYLRNFNGAVLLISHDRYFMDKIVTKTIEIEHKKSIVYGGNYSYFVQKKAADRALAEKQYAEQQKVLAHHAEVAKTIRSFKTEAAIIRAKSREKLLDKIERVEKPADSPTQMRLRLTPALKSGFDVLTAEDLSMAFPDKPLFANLSFELKKGDKTALIGPNGIGKTTLFKLITQELSPIGGLLRSGVNVQIGYYDQAHSFGAESERKTIFQEIADTYPRMTQTRIRTVLAAFMFIGDDVFKPISALSGGERSRVQLSKIMLAGANFLLLDEPTNHLDIFSKEILEEALREFDGTLLYISHDRYFINNTATKVLELDPHGVTAYHGNYDYYIEKKAEVANAAVPQGTAQPAVSVAMSSSKEEYLQKKERDANERRKKSRIAKLEAEIAATEQGIADCDAKLADDAVNRDVEAVQVVFAEKTALEETLAKLYDEWEEIAG